MPSDTNRCLCGFGELLRKSGEWTSAHIRENDMSWFRVNPAEVFAERGLSHDRNRARHLDSSWSCTNHHKGHQRLSPIWIIFDLSLLKGIQQVIPEGLSIEQTFEAGCEGGEFVARNSCG
jgi:hypothetical protein